MPVEVPTWGVKSVSYQPVDAIGYPVAAWARRLWWHQIRHDDFDDRRKVIAARSRRRVPYFSRIYAIQFAATEEEAVALSRKMLADWSSANHAEAKPIGPRERRRRRLRKPD
jgi:hypothetical protein